LNLINTDICGLNWTQNSTFDNGLYFCYIYISLELSGDLNSRTSNMPDYVGYKYLDTNLPFACCYDIPNRINSDKTIDAQAKRLLDLCISTGLLIANGRLHADKGKFTFSSHVGGSTVDYLLLELDDFTTLCDFEVLDCNEFSDHAALTFVCYVTKKSLKTQTIHTHRVLKIEKDKLGQK